MSQPFSPASAETGMTALFVRRPVLALVLNVLIAVAGLAALFGVEIASCRTSTAPSSPSPPTSPAPRRN